ncbi:MAG: trypsin-like peptidase domain-containing protein [Planctomycetota bacterium]|nr:trypsin-like peptidase domain-containing protein [Planctomycetota bacterium]
MRHNCLVAGVLTLTMLICTQTWGAKLVLNDGTIVEGTITRQGDDYTVKAADGTTQTVSAGDVKSFEFDPAPSSDSSSTDSSDSTKAETTPAFRAAKNRANDVEAALAAVAIWQEFVDKNPDSTDLPLAQEELKRWKTLANQSAEKINGKWIGGADRKKIIEQADELTRQGIAMYNNSESLKAVDKLQESARVYPNAYLPPFYLGELAFAQHNYDLALQYFQASVKLKPHAVEAINNLAVAQCFKNRWDQGIESFQQAAEIRDTKIIAQNLVTAIEDAPPNVRALRRLKDTIDASHLLATKYDIGGKSDVFLLMPIPPAKSKSGGGSTDDAPTSLWSGTGFFIDDKGLILTNRHVVKGSKTLLVQTSNAEMNADVVIIDDDQDLALIRVTPKGKVPFVHLAPEDMPNEGADCMVMGYPLPDRLGSDLKVTRGIVSSSKGDAQEGADVLTDAKVNPGNSGGPILDKYGNVIAIVCMKSIATATEDSYGIGISAGHIREFLKKNKIVLVAAGANPTAMDSEEIVTKVKPATVQIIATK